MQEDLCSQGKWSAIWSEIILGSHAGTFRARVLNRQANVNKHKHNTNNECPKILINQRGLKAI